MRIPNRKPGDYAYQKPDPHLTEAKYNELQRKFEDLKRNQPQAISEVKRLAEMGDFSENAAYQMAKGRLRGINQHILELGEQLKSAIIIKPIGNKKEVQLGSKVTIEMNGQEITYLILGSTETAPQKNIISHNSPLGAGLMGKRAGDLVMVIIGDKQVECRIIKVD